MGASYSHSFQPSLQPPSVIHRLHQGKRDHLLVLVSKVLFGSFKILDQSVFCYRALSSLASVAKALSKRLRVKHINQSILSNEKKKQIVFTNPLLQASPLQAQPRCSNEKSDLATGRPPGPAHWGGPHWPGKGEKEVHGNDDDDDDVLEDR